MMRLTTKSVSTIPVIRTILCNGILPLIPNPLVPSHVFAYYALPVQETGAYQETTEEKHVYD